MTYKNIINTDLLVKKISGSWAIRIPPDLAKIHNIQENEVFRVSISKKIDDENP